MRSIISRNYCYWMKVSINRIIAERELYKFLNLDQTKKFRAIIAECSGRFEGRGINLFGKLQFVFNILTRYHFEMNLNGLHQFHQWFASLESYSIKYENANLFIESLVFKFTGLRDNSFRKKIFHFIIS